MPSHVRMLSREGAITGRVLDADGGTGEQARRWRAGPVEPAAIGITSERGSSHAWPACATRT